MHTNQRILRHKDVLDLTGFSATALYREIESGTFPPPIKLSPNPARRAVGWLEREVLRMNQARIAGLGFEATRELVSNLVKQRQGGGNE